MHLQIHWLMCVFIGVHQLRDPICYSNTQVRLCVYAQLKMCMYVCMHVCMYVCMYDMYTCMQVGMHGSMYGVYTHVLVVPLCVCGDGHAKACVRTRECVIV